MNAGTIIGYGVPLLAVGVVVFALVKESQERRRLEDAKKLGKLIDERDRRILEGINRGRFRIRRWGDR